MEDRDEQVRNTCVVAAVVAAAGVAARMSEAFPAGTGVGPETSRHGTVGSTAPQR